MKKISAVLLPLLFVMRAVAQDAPGEASIQLAAKAYGDSIVLRWAPSSAAAWQVLNATGYSILRLDKTQGDGKWTILKEKLRPLALEEMKKKLDRDNRYAAIAAQALYGKTIYIERKGMGPAISQQSDILSNRFALALQSADYSAPVARAIALGWTDKNVTKGEAYVYKIVPTAAIKDLTIIPVSLVVVNEQEAMERPQGIVAIGGDHKAELQWPRNQADHYSGYGIEVSEDGKNYKPLYSSPYYSAMPDTTLTLKDSVLQRLSELLKYNHVFIDSLVKNYQTYFYRIRGINAFGEWSPWSEPVAVSGRDLTPPSSVLLGTPEATGKKTIRLTWAKDVREKDLKGFSVYRSRAVDGPYALLTKDFLPVTANQYADNDAWEYGPNFYMVVAADTAGNQNASLPVMGLLPDTTAPHIPKGLKGSIDTQGLVHLDWTPNDDEDIKGYKVYFSHAADQQFLQITLYPEADHQFTDSIELATLTKKIYYRVVAVDQHNNHSGYSEILELKKPDIVPPVPPVILDASMLPATAQLVFSNSASTDVVRYTILRKEGNAEWKTMASVLKQNAANGFTYSDSSVQHGTIYQYAAKAIDEDGLESAMCTPVTMQLRGTEELKEIRLTKASYDAEQHAVILQWNYSSPQPHYLVIYRSVTEGPLERYRTLEQGTKEWKDFQIADINKGYQYAVQAVFNNHSKVTALGQGVIVKSQ